MQTEEQIKDTVKAERKKVFWLLYTFPWTILTILLSCIIIGLIIYPISHPIKVEKGAYTESVKSNNSISYINFETSNFSRAMGEMGTAKIENDIAKKFYIEAVKGGYGEWVVDKEGEVSFRWKPSTESVISSQVQSQVNSKVKQLQDNYRTNAIEILENKRKETITECLKAFQIEAVNKGVGKWIADNNGNTEFKWKLISEIVKESVSTESNNEVNAYMVNRGVKINGRYVYTESKDMGMDLEREIIKSSVLGIESAFFGNNSNKDKELKEKVKVEVSKGIHVIFDGFEALNKTDKRML